MKEAEIKKVVREGYARRVRERSSCCAPSGADLSRKVSRAIGYTDEELSSVPEGANLGLGCGNPVALASLAPGETVLDLGSGAGFDAFLAAGRVGRKGKVIGVDMTPEMIEQARANAQKGGYTNVEFRLGEIENIPAADSSVDVVISNCVINLSPDKARVFAEAFRVLKPGGRLMVSDIVLLKELPDFIRNSMVAYIGCVAGAMLKNEYLETIRDTGFQQVKVVDEAAFPVEWALGDPAVQAIIDKLNLAEDKLKDIASSVVSIKVQGIKPK
ncbi:MAG TPA: arsenite methyltransferase [Dehalococcoidia bacterium]|jgi:SAM-dependent methyltransferase|nr:arsenite methyltransferase [Dehalococcoidia bacterium]